MFPTRMIPTAAMVSAVVLFVACGRSAEPAATNLIKDHRAKLQGTWQVIQWVDRSEEAASPAEIKNFTFEFQGDLVTIRKNRRDTGARNKFTIDPAKQPMWMDLRTGDGAVATAIYELKGDQLTICVVAGALPGEMLYSRPSQFKASKKDRHVLFVLRKAKQ